MLRITWKLSQVSSSPYVSVSAYDIWRNSDGVTLNVGAECRRGTEKVQFGTNAPSFDFCVKLQLSVFQQLNAYLTWLDSDTVRGGT